MFTELRCWCEGLQNFCLFLDMHQIQKHLQLLHRDNFLFRRQSFLGCLVQHFVREPLCQKHLQLLHRGNFLFRRQQFLGCLVQHFVREESYVTSHESLLSMFSDFISHTETVWHIFCFLNDQFLKMSLNVSQCFLSTRS